MPYISMLTMLVLLDTMNNPYPVMLCLKTASQYIFHMLHDFS